MGMKDIRKVRALKTNFDINVFGPIGPFAVALVTRDQILVVAALAVAAPGIMHSLIDFSLQIPDFAIVVFALIGAGLAQSFRLLRSAP
jgi:hypothetical protein